MSISRDNKVEKVNEIKEKLKESKSIVVINYKGTTVDKVNALRRQFRNENVEYKVYKNRLFLKALNDMGINGCDEYLQGENGMIFSYGDELAGARIVNDFILKNRITSFVFGVVNNKVVDKAYVEKLSKLPSKNALVGQLLSVLNGPIRGIAVALNAIAEQKSN